jgi:hypothetical protein
MPSSSGRSVLSGPRGTDQSHSGNVSPPSAPAHHVTTNANASVLGMKRKMPCSRSNQHWASDIGVNTRRQRPGPATRL